MVDLGQITDDALSQDDRLRGGFLALKYVFREQDQPTMVLEIAKALRDDPEYAKVVLRYLIQEYGRLDMAGVQEFSEELFPGEAEQYKSIFAREMLAKGEAKGRQEESASMLSRLLQRRFGDVPTWAHDNIAKADLLTLEEWSLRILDAQSLEDVFES